jgi:hypothetical protein
MEIFMPRQIDRRAEELRAGLRALFTAAPWMAMAVMFSLTPEQWKAILDGDVHVLLRKKIGQRSLRVLDRYGLRLRKYGDDITHEVLLKLIEGKFLKCYDPARVHPRAHLIGAAQQYARTLARSFWCREARECSLEE